MRARILGPKGVNARGKTTFVQTFNFKGRPPDAVADEIARAIINAADFAAIRISASKLEELGQFLREAATAEAVLMLGAIESVLTAGRKSFGAEEMGLPRLLLERAFNNRTLNTGGAVDWTPLSEKYLKWKEKKNPETAELILTRTGAMARYFRRYGSSLVTSRFGGVTIDVQPAKDALDALGDKPVRLTNQAKGDIPSHRTVLGKIDIRIFPNIATALLPGLASRRWADVGSTNGSMERAMLAPSVAVKLAGGGVGGSEVPYRPLILPITQFWMLIRIPNAIALALKDNIRSLR